MAISVSRRAVQLRNAGYNTGTRFGRRRRCWSARGGGRTEPVSSEHTETRRARCAGISTRRMRKRLPKAVNKPQGCPARPADVAEGVVVRAVRPESDDGPEVRHRSDRARHWRLVGHGLRPRLLRTPPDDRHGYMFHQVDRSTTRLWSPRWRGPSGCGSHTRANSGSSC